MTPTFAAAWRRVGRTGVVLARFDVPDTGGTVHSFYLSTSDVITPDGQYWAPCLTDVHPITDRRTFCGTDLGVPTTTLTLGRGPIPGLATPGQTIFEALGQYRWLGAPCSIYLWETSITTVNDPNTGLPNLLLLLPGEVLNVESSQEAVTFQVRLRHNWNRQVQVPISPDIFPQAPVAAIGQVAPALLGRITAPKARAPWTTPYPGNGALDYVRGGLGLAQAVVTDEGRALGVNPAATVRVLAAGHPLTTFGDVTQGCGTFITLDGVPFFVNLTPHYDARLGSYLDTPAAGYFAYAACPISSVASGANSADNVGNLLHPENEYRFATLHAGSPSGQSFAAQFSGHPDLGLIHQIKAYIGYRTRTDGSGNFAWWLRWARDNNSAAGIVLAASPTPTVATLIVSSDTDAPSVQMGWGLNSFVLDTDLNQSFASFKGQVDVFFVGLVINFYPRRPFVQQLVKTLDASAVRPLSRRPPSGGGLANIPSRFAPSWRVTTDVPVLDTQGNAFVNGIGPSDDGAGSFTGTPNAVIERLPDLAAYMLWTFGVETGGKLELTPGAWGSMTDARALMQTWRYADMIYALSLPDAVDLKTALGWLGACGPAMITLSTCDNKWKVIPWRTSPPADYDLMFTPEHLAAPDSLRASYGPSSYLVTGIGVLYGPDAGHSGFARECRAEPLVSRAGYDYYDLRDESVAIVSSINDRLDFTANAGPQRNAALTLASPNDPASLALDVQRAMRAAEPTLGFYTAWDFTVATLALGGTVTGSIGNDMIPFWMKAGTLNFVGLGAQAYASPEALAAAAQVGLSILDSTPWTVTYSRATRKFTFAVPGGTAGVSGLAWGQLAQANVAEHSAAALFGFAAADKRTGLSWAADNPAEPERFRICSSAQVSLLWGSGTNGYAAVTPRSCATALGFEPSADVVGATPSFFSPPCPKNVRESKLAAALALYNQPRVLNVDAHAIFDSDTAREARNRFIKLLGTPRVEARWATAWAPDLEPGRVVQFSSAMDALLPYPDPDSDGSWAGKTLIVVEATKEVGPTSVTSKLVAIDCKEAA